MRWIVSLLVNSVVLIAVSGLLKGVAPGAFEIENVQTAIIASIILAILNVFVKPFLILITLPITVVTFGFFLIVINAITLKITASLLGDTFYISGFGVAIVVAVCISIFTIIIEKAIVEPLFEKNRK
jgi:putative membrane protein